MEGIQVSVSATGANNDISLIKVGGYIDTTTSAEVERALDSVLRQGRYNIVIDLGNVDYISSAGWGIFISEIKGIREKGGDLKLVNMIPDVYEVFELLEFHYILKAFDTLEDAIQDFELKGGHSSPGRAELDENQQIESSMVFDEGKKEPLEREESGSSEVENRSLREKLHRIILEKPDSTLPEIKKILNSEPYNFTKVGIFSLWNQLRKMGLGSKKRRLEFFKKNAFQDAK